MDPRTAYLCCVLLVQCLPGSKHERVGRNSSVLSTNTCRAKSGGVHPACRTLFPQRNIISTTFTVKESCLLHGRRPDSRNRVWNYSIMGEKIRAEGPFYPGKQLPKVITVLWCTETSRTPQSCNIPLKLNFA